MPGVFIFPESSVKLIQDFKAILIAAQHGQPASALHQPMRITGKLVDNDRRIAVYNPYTNALLGTIPKATVEDVRSVFHQQRPTNPH